MRACGMHVPQFLLFPLSRCAVVLLLLQFACKLSLFTSIYDSAAANHIFSVYLYFLHFFDILVIFIYVFFFIFRFADFNANGNAHCICEAYLKKKLQNYNKKRNKN